MEFEILERKFKFVDDELFSYHKHGRSQTEKWHLVKISLSKNGYKRFAFIHKGKYKQFLFHRVLYYANNLQWNLLDGSTENSIDHIDNDKTNNHISNLRVVTNQENQFNRKCLGYSFNKESGKYEARINLNYKKIYLGSYDTPEEARDAYLKKKEEVHIIEAR